MTSRGSKRLKLAGERPQNVLEQSGVLGCEERTFKSLLKRLKRRKELLHRSVKHGKNLCSHVHHIRHEIPKALCLLLGDNLTELLLQPLKGIAQRQLGVVHLGAGLLCIFAEELVPKCKSRTSRSTKADKACTNSGYQYAERLKRGKERPEGTNRCDDKAHDDL